MNFDKFASDLPSQYTEWFTTPEALEIALNRRGISQPTRQSSRGEFRAGLAYRSTEVCELFADRYNTALSLRLCTPPETVGILIPRSVSGRFMASGRDLANEHLLVFPGGSEADISGPAPIGSDDMAIPGTRFIEMLETLCPTADCPRELTAVKVDGPHLLALGDEVVSQIGISDTELQGECLSNFLATIISLIGYGLGQSQHEELKDMAARSRVAKSARELIEANFRHAVLMEHLCCETGVGVRTLQRCFREYYDFTVTDYLKTVRLDSAYRELLAANPEEASVTQVALRNGFTHLGRFSVVFHRRFGESPSEVLKS